MGLSQRDVAQNILISLSSSFQTAPTFWLNPQNQISYNLAVQTPQYRNDSIQALLDTPIHTPPLAQPQILGNLASFSHMTQASVVSHYNVQPLVDVYASVQGRDLGGVARDVRRLTASVQSQLPRGSHIKISGQVQTMSESFIGLGVGVVMAIVLAYLLIVVNFQSWLDPFIIITALPGAMAGIVWALLLTHTTLNVPSLTGAIMCVGVATANSILMVSFARQRMDEGLPARDAAGSRTHADAPGADDRAGHDDRHGAHGAGYGRRRRAERAVGPGGDRRTIVRHSGNAVLCSGGVFDRSRAAGEII